jgi:hypothetical protein
MERFRFVFGSDQKTGMEWLVFDSAHLLAMLGEITSTFVTCSYLQQHTIKISAAFHLYFRQ